jgi:hypothetical protein
MSNCIKGVMKSLVRSPNQWRLSWYSSGKISMYCTFVGVEALALRFGYLVRDHCVGK